MYCNMLCVVRYVHKIIYPKRNYLTGFNNASVLVYQRNIKPEIMDILLTTLSPSVTLKPISDTKPISDIKPINGTTWMH